MGILDERAGVAVEVDRLARIEKHRLFRVHLQDEILERAQSDHRGNGVGLLFRTAVELAQLVRHLAGRGYHVCDQVVGIDHRAFARLHLAFGKLHHAVGKMRDMVAPVGIAQFLEDELQHLKMVVLLVAHDINHVVEPVLLEAAVSRAEVLRHVDRGAVAAQERP